MRTFIEDYLQDPSMAIAAARQTADSEFRFENVDENTIYHQLASGEFRLYEEMIFASTSESALSSRVYQ